MTLWSQKGSIFLANNDQKVNSLYLNLGDEDGHMRSSFERYVNLLKARAPKGLIPVPVIRWSILYVGKIAKYKAFI